METQEASVEIDETDNSILNNYTDSQLQTTWNHLLDNNLTKTSALYKADLIKRIWPKKCVFTSLMSSSTTTRRGKRFRSYPRKAIIGTKDKVGINRLAAWISTGERPLKDVQASHYICDNEECINPGHLTWEDWKSNTTRLCCKTYKHLPNYKCPHKPICPGANPC
jgi:hypothetical protein